MNKVIKMEIMDTVQLSLEENQQMTDELKTNILELMTIFHKKFPDVKLDSFNNRIKSLTIERGSKYVFNEALNYNIKNNVLSINEALLEQADAKHELMVLILKMITSKDDYYGFNKDNEFSALSAGVTEIVADFLVGNECE